MEQSKFSLGSDVVRDIRLIVLTATRNRPESLRAMINSVRTSSVRPSEIIVVDSSDHHIFNMNRKYLRSEKAPDDLQVHHVPSSEKSLTRQKNQGLQLISQLELTYICVLDDDVLVESDTLGHLCSSLSRSNVIGAGPVASGCKKPLGMGEKLLRIPHYLSGLDRLRQCSVTYGGVGTPLYCNETDEVKAQWLIGCSMWKGHVFKTLNFNDGFNGSALFEDVEFSVRAAKLGELRVNPEAKLKHLQSDIGRFEGLAFWRRFTRNRWEVMKIKYGYFAIPLFFLSNTLMIVGTLIWLILSPKKFMQGARLLGGITMGLLDTGLMRPAP